MAKPGVPLDIVCLCAFLMAAVPALGLPSVRVRTPSDARPCVHWGASGVCDALARTGHEVTTAGLKTVEIAIDPSELRGFPDAARPEGYRIKAGADGVRITGYDAAGAMYGCVDLAARIRESRMLPTKLDYSTGPAMSLRSACILLMKLGLYDYPITPEEFPFFYDKKFWIEYLDFLVENRYNAITFWNGHPFAYFVKLDKFPEAQDGMPPGQVEKNHEMLMWLSKEAEKRNIWLLFEFYNIHVSTYFARAHNLPPHGISEPTPLLEDYTNYSIARFVSEFPNIGLYVCVGEALKYEYAVDWVNNVILSAVKSTGKTPPVVIRSWVIDLEAMKKIKGHYPRLYTEMKFDVEMLSSPTIDPRNAEWAKSTGEHVVNVHMTSNFDPFRWSVPSYIQECMNNAVGAGGTGLHLYPRRSWRWPYGAEVQHKGELQWVRDRMWFETWGRYAWKPDREPELERKYWLGKLKDEFGSAESAEHILRSFEEAADVLPAIQRLVWLGDSNHTIVSAGILLEQLQTAPGHPFIEFPEMIRIPAYIEALKKGEKIEGIFPIQLLAAKVAEADAGVEHARLGAAKARRSRTNAERFSTDAEAVALVARFYLSKLKAAVAKSLYDAGIDRAANGRLCLSSLKESLEHYRALTAKMLPVYDSISDVPAWHPFMWQDNNWQNTGPCPYHWSDILPYFEKEYEDLVAQIGEN